MKGVVTQSTNTFVNFVDNFDVPCPATMFNFKQYVEMVEAFAEFLSNLHKLEDLARESTAMVTDQAELLKEWGNKADDCEYSQGFK